jgi:MORN repeat
MNTALHCTNKLLVHCLQDVFKGEWRGGMAHGWGKKQFRCGDLHEGYYKEDKRSGFGIYIWVNGGTLSLKSHHYSYYNRLLIVGNAVGSSRYPDVMHCLCCAGV